MIPVSVLNFKSGRAGTEMDLDKNLEIPRAAMNFGHIDICLNNEISCKP